mgnify:FL=1
MGSILSKETQIESLDILQIEDDPADAILTAKLLKKATNIDLHLHQADSLSSALSVAQDNPFDAIILDLHLPDASGLEAVRCIHHRYPNRAIIVMTGNNNDEQAKQAMLFGAQDYLVKGACSGDMIWRSLRHAIERKRFEQKLEALAKYDALTGLANRTLCLERLNQLQSSLKRYGGEAAVLFLDLDKFKWVNDNLGHDRGDQLLKTIAERLIKCVRHGDLVARIGGDEFVIILERVKHPLFASKVAQKVIDLCNLPVNIEEQDVYVGASIGIAMCDVKSATPAAVLKHADLAMYRAKECGRNNFQFYTQELNVHARGRAILANSLHEAISKEELELYYQPKVKVENNQICGAEVLLRWNHPATGLVLPDVFIPLLEETGLILPAGKWVLEKACRQFNQWYQLGLVHANDKIAVNLSAKQFIYTDLVETTNRIVESSGLPAHMLELELTESMLMEDSIQTKKVLLALQKLGVHIAIDDFGTGYSCLSNLKRFPINRLKIDKSFMTDIHKDAENKAICSAVLSLAHELGIMVTAEGVENQGALDFLLKRRCENYQGYYYSPPLPKDEFEALLISNQERVMAQKKRSYNEKSNLIIDVQNTAD